MRKYQMPKQYDFAGYATKANVRCADGRVILRNAFQHQDGARVSLMWQHLHESPLNVIGKAYLEHRDDGMYAYGVLNDSKYAKHARELIRHGDITQLSIFANKLKEKGKNVQHGTIREVSLVISGANPEARIENLGFAHSDGGFEETTENVIIHSGTSFDYSIPEDDDMAFEHGDDDDYNLDNEDESAGSGDDDDISHGDDDLTPPPPKSKKPLTRPPAKQQPKPPARSPAAGSKQAASDDDDGDLSHADNEETIGDVFNAFSQKQKKVVYAMMAQAISDQSGQAAAQHSGTGGLEMKKNIFDGAQGAAEGTVDISVEDRKAILHSALSDRRGMGSKTIGAPSPFYEAVMEHALDAGISNIELLFPEARNVNAGGPELVQREKAWVNQIMRGVNRAAFANIRSMSADITEDDARAKGYITGNKKFAEVFGLLQRVTNPTTVYSRQELHRDDQLDITDFDVVTWLHKIQRLMLEEEIARAMLVGDGRAITSRDKVREDCVRPIWTDDKFFAPKITIKAGVKPSTDMIDEITLASEWYEGSGEPIMWTTKQLANRLNMVRDANGHRIYRSRSELADAMDVRSIINVPIMKGLTRTNEEGQLVKLLAVLVDPSDYTIGTNRGGEITSFEDFDIDFNTNKYLLETRISGALTKWRSAVVIEQEVNGVG